MTKYSELFRILKKDGWYKVRQKGSHIIMQHPTKEGPIIFPYHAAKGFKTGVLKFILKQAGIKINKR